MTYEVNRLDAKVRRLEERIPGSFNFFQGGRLPAVDSKEVVFWEDPRLDVGRIAMRVGSKIYIFTSASSTVIGDGTPGDPPISGLDHGGLSGLVPSGSDLNDDHTQYITTTPQTDTRNTITPAGTEDIALQCYGFIGFQGVENANWSGNTFRGVLYGSDSFPGYTVGWDSGALLALGVNSYLANASPFTNRVDTAKGAAVLHIIGPDDTGTNSATTNAGGSDDQVYFRFMQKSQYGGEWAVMELREGQDRRGKVVIGGDVKGTTGGQWNLSGGDPQGGGGLLGQFRAIILSEDQGNAPETADQLGGLAIYSDNDFATNSGIPLYVATSQSSVVPGVTTLGVDRLARFVADHYVSDGKAVSNANVELRIQMQNVAWYSDGARRCFPTIWSIGGNDSEVFRISERHYLWVDTGGAAGAGVPASDPRCFGGIRMSDYYILGVDKRTVPEGGDGLELVKLWDIGSTTSISTTGLPNTEQAKISAASIQGYSTGTGFLATDNTGTNSGLAYTLTNAEPFTFPGAVISAPPALDIDRAIFNVGNGSPVAELYIDGNTAHTDVETVAITLLNNRDGSSGSLIQVAGLVSGTYVNGTGDVGLISASGSAVSLSSDTGVSVDSPDVEFSNAGDVTIRTSNPGGSDIIIQSDFGDVDINAPSGFITLTDSVGSLGTSGPILFTINRNTVIANSTADPELTLQTATVSGTMSYDEGNDRFNFANDVIVDADLYVSNLNSIIIGNVSLDANSLNWEPGAASSFTIDVKDALLVSSDEATGSSARPVLRAQTTTAEGVTNRTLFDVGTTTRSYFTIIANGSTSGVSTFRSLNGTMNTATAVGWTFNTGGAMIGTVYDFQNNSTSMLKLATTAATFAQAVDINNDSLTLGLGAGGDPTITFDGSLGDGALAWDNANQRFETSNPFRFDARLQWGTDATTGGAWTSTQSSGNASLVHMFAQANNTSTGGFSTYGMKFAANHYCTAGAGAGTTGGWFSARQSINSAVGALLRGGFFVVDDDGGNRIGVALDECLAGSFLVDLSGGSSNTWTAGAGVKVDVKAGGTPANTITTFRGLWVTTPTLSGAGTITNLQAIHIEDMTGQSRTTMDAMLVDAQNGTGSGAAFGNIRMAGADWNTGHFQFASGHLWNNGGNLYWNSAAPTGGTDGSLVIVQPSAPTYSPSNVSTDRTYDANATSIDELADVLGTLIADLQSIGALA